MWNESGGAVALFKIIITVQNSAKEPLCSVRTQTLALTAQSCKETMICGVLVDLENLQTHFNLAVWETDSNHYWCLYKSYKSQKDLQSEISILTMSLLRWSRREWITACCKKTSFLNIYTVRNDEGWNIWRLEKAGWDKITITYLKLLITFTFKYKFSK